MNAWLLTHLIFIGLWGGCVAVEMVIEFWGRKDTASKHQTAQLHYLIDIYVEVPILIVVLISGIALFNVDNLIFPTYKVKIIAGLIPVLINIYCLVPVIRRKHASDNDDVEAMDGNTRLIFFCFVTGFASAMVALAAGLHIVGII